MTADSTAFENHWTLWRFLESFFRDSVEKFSKQFDHDVGAIYCLKDKTNKSRRAGSTDELRLEAVFTFDALGGGMVVVVVVVVVVGGGGFGSSLQHVLGRVSFPPLLSGQQKFPYPMSLHPWSFTHGSSLSWSKYSWPQQYCPLQQARFGQSESPFSEQSTMLSMHNPLWMFLLSWCLKHTRSDPHCSLDLQVALRSFLSTAESSSQG